MEYSVNVTMRTAAPLTADALFDVAALGGVAVGFPGDTRLETTLTVEAENVLRAGARAAELVSRLIAGNVLAVSVMTADEADRRLAERPDIVGVTEVAKILGVTKQRVSTLSRRDDFPEPLARLSAGPIWRVGDLSTFAGGWQRKPGRPRTRKAAAN